MPTCVRETPSGGQRGRNGQGKRCSKTTNGKVAKELISLKPGGSG